MSESTPSTKNQVISFAGAVGAILIFLLILFVAYLPNRPAPVDEEIDAERRAKAEEALTAGQKKLSEYSVVDAEEGLVTIPIDRAMELTVNSYNAGEAEGGE